MDQSARQRAGDRMNTSSLNPEARKENIKTLAAAIGMNHETAEQLLDAEVLITYDPTCPSDRILAEQISQLLERTVSHVGQHLHLPPTVEIVIRLTNASSEAPTLWVTPSYPIFTIARSFRDAQGQSETLTPLLSQIGACYVAAMVLKTITGDLLPYLPPDPFILDLSVFEVPPDLTTKPIEVGSTYLVGAGAIGNAVLWALRHFDIHGELHIVDHDMISSGNLNRQIWFREEDIGLPKAERLATLASPCFSNFKLIPRIFSLENLPEKSAAAWMKRLIVAVDSRRVRRSLQSEFPGEVFDASTTDISEIVLHFNKQPTELACLSCIYPPDRAELAREQHIAEHLGVTIEDVQKRQIDRTAAGKIITRFQRPGLSVDELEGQAYDSLFKALCGQAQLQTVEGRQVLAPFAFVSVLAGTLLAIAFVRRSLYPGVPDYNYWRLSPWQPAQPRLKRVIPADPSCSFCGQPVLRKVAQKLWAR